MNNQLADFIQSLQQQWACPITQQPMSDPVITCDGHTYERKAIILWFNKQQTSPKTNLPLSNKQLIPNIIMRNIIKKFTQENHSFLRRSKIMDNFGGKENENNNGISGIKKDYQKELEQKNKKIEQLQKQIEILNQLVNDLLENKQNNQKENQKNQNYQNLIQQKLGFNKFQQYPLISKSQRSLDNSVKNLTLYQQQKHPLYFNKKELKLPQNFTSIKSILYLQNIFNSNKIIEEKYYKIKNNSYLYVLNHEGFKIKMQQFVKYNWTNLILLDLKNTQMDDYQWKIFVQNGDRFPNLETIQIYNNQIQTVNVKDFQQFKKLKQIWFYHIYGGTNRLSDKSRQNLALAKKIYKNLEINY